MLFRSDVAMNSRLAADAVGATKMDRPEWCAVDPTSGEIYYTLTNNANRKLEPTGTQFGLDAANPRTYTDAPSATAATAARNVNGHIMRMKEAGGEGTATSFTWDVYLFGAQADADKTMVNLSGLTDDQDFSSPDGLWFSPKTGFVFIQTDDGAFTASLFHAHDVAVDVARRARCAAGKRVLVGARVGRIQPKLRAGGL